MIDELTSVVSTVIIAAGTGFSSWVYARKRNNADTKTVEIDNEIKLSNQYKDMLDDLPGRYEQRFKEYDTHVKAMAAEYEASVQIKEKLLKEEIVLLRRENKILKVQLAEKNREITARDKQIALLQKSNGSDSITRPNIVGHSG
jgi:hypothetical protein